jgi:hypothetical protein
LALLTMVNLKMSRPWMTCLTRRTRKRGKLRCSNTFENLVTLTASWDQIVWTVLQID